MKLMNKMSDLGFRIIVFIAFAAAAATVSSIYYKYEQNSVVNKFVNEQVKNSLEQTFYSLWDDAKRSGSPESVHSAVVRLLLNEYNYKNKSVFVASVGKHNSKDLPRSLVKSRLHSLNLRLADSTVEANIITMLPDNQRAYYLGAIVVLFGGFLVFVLYPAYQPLDQFRLAKIYGCIFDRKVSSKKSWGAWQLTHLGTGSGMVNIHPNGYAQANNEESVNTCVDGIRAAIDTVEIAFLKEIKNFSDWPSNQKELARILEKIRTSLKCRPLLRGEEDVATFISYVRGTALNTVAIDLTKPEIYKNILGVEASDIEVSLPSRWLIDGFQVFMPKTVWENILRSLNAGIRMAYNTKISGLKLYSNEDIPFIFIDFIIEGKILDKNNVSRIKEYLKRPFPGDLDDLVNAMSDYGRLMILDPQRTLDLTDRRASRKGVVKTLTVRFMLRRIDKDERKQVIAQMDKALMSTPNRLVHHDT